MKKINNMNTIGIITITLLLLIVIMNFRTAGFRSNNAIILAPSKTIMSTINGRVSNNLPKIGQQVDKNDLLVNLLNERIDKSRLVEYQSQLKFLKNEIATTKQLQNELTNLYDNYRIKAQNYNDWMLKDTELKSKTQIAQLNEAKKISEQAHLKAKRLKQLYKNSHVSNVSLTQAHANVAIAKNEVEINAVELKRSQLLLGSMSENGVFFEGGEASYWEKMLDSIILRQLDIASKLITLNSEFAKISRQEIEEKKRINSSYTEKIVAPFKGIVSSIYVNNDTQVTVGTGLLQVLDC